MALKGMCNIYSRLVPTSGQAMFVSSCVKKYCSSGHVIVSVILIVSLLSYAFIVITLMFARRLSILFIRVAFV